MPSDRSGPIERLTTAEDDVPHEPTTVTPDGRVLLFSRRLGLGHSEVWEAPLEGERPPTPVLEGSFFAPAL